MRGESFGTSPHPLNDIKRAADRVACTKSRRLLRKEKVAVLRLRFLTERSINTETLEIQLRDVMAKARSQVVGPAQFCAWTRVLSLTGRSGVASKAQQMKT